MPEHQICLGFMPFFACICFVLQLLTGFCMCRLLYDRDRRPAHISWPICCIHIYPGQGARAHDMCILVFMMTPGANTFLFIAHYNCSGVPRAPFLARLFHCSAAGLPCFVHDVPARVSRHHYIQTLSPAQLQPITSACVPARPACACVPGVCLDPEILTASSLHLP